MIWRELRKLFLRKMQEIYVKHFAKKSLNGTLYENKAKSDEFQERINKKNQSSNK